MACHPPRGRGGGEARRRACAGRTRCLDTEGMLALMGFVVVREAYAGFHLEHRLSH